MPNFLRDQAVTNVRIDRKVLEQIYETFLNIHNKLIENAPRDDDGGKTPFFYFTIRFDGKGYRVFTFDELLSYFQSAKDIERLIFTIETGESLRTHREVGLTIELRLEQNIYSNCTLLVTSDDKSIVNSYFFEIIEILNNCKTKYNFVRTSWIELFIQIVGISLGFILSLFLARNYSHRFNVEYSFFVLFIFIFLIFANIWPYISRNIHLFLNNLFPNVYFYRPDKHRFTWFIQMVVTTIVGATILWALGIMTSYLVNILGSLLTNH